MVYFYQLFFYTDDVILKLYTSLCQKAKCTLFVWSTVGQVAGVSMLQLAHQQPLAARIWCCSYALTRYKINWISVQSVLNSFVSYNIHVSGVAYTQQQIHEYYSLSSDNNEYLADHAITSSCEYCKQVAPTCNKQMNFSTLCKDIQLLLYLVIAQLQHQIQYEIIGVQIAALKLKQSNVGSGIFTVYALCEK